MTDDPSERQLLLELIQVQEEYDRRVLWDRMGEKAASFDAGCLLWLTKYTRPLRTITGRRKALNLSHRSHAKNTSQSYSG